MNKKLISKVLSFNLNSLIFSVLFISNFMRDVTQVFYTPYGMVPNTINSVSYTLLQMKIDVMINGSPFIYHIYNYPLVPISITIIYNIYMLIKIYRNKDNAQPS